MLFECKTLSKLAIQLAKVHIRVRFQEPPSSKKYFRLFYELKSTDPRIPTAILNGVEINEEDSLLHMRFTHKDGPLIYWRGEGDISSMGDLYLVDRSHPKIKIYLGGSFIYTDIKPCFSLLSKKQYSKIGEIVHKDPNYYVSETSTSYNYATGHGYHRMGGEPTGIGSNTTSKTMPNIAAKCLLHVDVTYDPVQLYDAMMATPK